MIASLFVSNVALVFLPIAVNESSVINETMNTIAADERFMDLDGGVCMSRWVYCLFRCYLTSICEFQTIFAHIRLRICETFFN